MKNGLAEPTVPLKIVFLGTGGWVPTQQRGTSSLLIDRGGDRLLFDVGEGTARQLRRYNISPKISNIFLTSNEIDHVGGLPSLLHALGIHGRPKDEQLNIYTPEDSEEAIEELVGIHGGVDYPINIDSISPGRELVFGDYKIKTLTTDTTNPSVGYALVEKSRRGEFDREYADKKGVPPQRFQELIDGSAIELDDGTVVQPNDVLDDPRPGRRVVYTGDTRPVDTIIEAGADADLLIHEAMFDETQNERAVETGHSTALEAAEVARQASAKRLVLTNISARYTGRDFVLRQDAESVFDGEIMIARDGKSVDIPYPDQNNVNYEDINETKPIEDVREQRESLREQIRNLREMAKSGYIEASYTQIEDLITGLEEIIEVIDNSVMVLGKFQGLYRNELEDLTELLQKEGYDANIAEDLPEYGKKTLEQNVAIYMMLSKFSIMVDRNPSGHTVEYETAKRQGEILARLIKKDDDSQSTYMIGGAEDVDLNHIQAFEFEDRPQERLDDAIEWAESVVSERHDAYQSRYPWRGDE